MEALLKEHADIYREFLPTLNKYSDMAKRVLGLQQKIFDGQLREQFPDAVFDEAPLIAKVSARETPARLRGLLDELAKKAIAVTRVTYDPAVFEFHLYGK